MCGQDAVSNGATTRGPACALRPSLLSNPRDGPGPRTRKMQACARRRVRWQAQRLAVGRMFWFMRKRPSLPTYVRHGARKELE